MLAGLWVLTSGNAYDILERGHFGFSLGNYGHEAQVRLINANVPPPLKNVGCNGLIAISVHHPGF